MVLDAGDWFDGKLGWGKDSYKDKFLAVFQNVSLQ